MELPKMRAELGMNPVIRIPLLPMLLKEPLRNQSRPRLNLTRTHHLQTQTY
jgi:hypothetical protein